MNTDFESLPDRRGTNALKWERMPAGPLSPLPLWVADMDFPAPPAARRALADRVAHGVFGYTLLPDAYFQAVEAWYAQRSGRTWRAPHFVLAPSVLHGLSMALRALTAPGDRVLNFPPVYFPFYRLLSLNGREVVDVPLVRRGRWELDFAAIEATLDRCRAEGRPVKALLFSAPHNPTGRVWTVAELTRLTELLIRHDVLMLSDEIHSDLILPGHTHVSPLDLPGMAARTLVFTGPNKTFNLAGLPISHVVALDEGLRRTMKRATEADFYDQPNVFSMTAALACYREEGPWVDELLTVIARNKADLDRWAAARGLRVEALEGTYLAWLDAEPAVRAGGFTDDKDLEAYLETTTQVKFTNGSTFQTGGLHHLRVNLATPRTVLAEALERVGAALSARAAGAVPPSGAGAER